MLHPKITYIVILFLLIAGCFSPSRSGDSNLQKAPKGNVYYGGTFHFNEEEYFRSLFPHNIGEVGGHRIANMIYEGLVRLKQDSLTLEPSLAERWEVNEHATQYTLHLRKGVKFHNDPCFPNGKGREVTAQDIKYCFDLLCSPSSTNIGWDYVRGRIVGSEEHYEAVKKGSKPEGGVKGIKIIDDYTLQIDLNQPFSSFLYILAMPFGYIFPHEAYEKYGIEMRIKAVGTGPFYIKTVRENEAVILLRNTHYWDKDQYGNQLPYLNGVRFSFINDKMAELLKFKEGKLDMVFKLPFEIMDEIVDRKGNLQGEYQNFVFQDLVSMSVQYYGFLTDGKIFADKRLRQAFCYAVNRDKIVEFTLKGSGVPGIYGFVPPAFPNYNHAALNGYNYNPEKARALLAAAGYPNGKGMPEVTLQINSGGKRNEQVAEAVQKMLREVLNIRVKIAKVPFSQHLEMQETRKTDFWRAGWIADYPDPENFLTFLWSKHLPKNPNERTYQNTFRYRNEQYDQLFAQALQIVDEKQRNELYQKADQIALDDAPFLPLYYDKDKRLLQKYVRNFPQNPMEYRLLHKVYFEPQETNALSSK
jgi:oligopeptide transport system substrate-binding protein